MKTLILAVLLIPGIVFAECKEFRIVETASGMEAVCVGEPLTAAQVKEIEVQREKEHKAIQEAEVQRIKTEKAATVTASQPAITDPVQIASKAEDIGSVKIGSYDVKYIPGRIKFQDTTGQSRIYPGAYSIKIDTTNQGKRGTINFKLKQLDFSGYETESIAFSEHFEKDQSKTATAHLPANHIPTIQSDKWLIEAYKD